ncbi:MAG: choice-of-anchor D domain-containing protein [Phycisphaerae bacterium]|nr:choice-of-anchor D domain-containing protein [Phycisphaerae bacterium]
MSLLNEIHRNVNRVNSVKKNRQAIRRKRHLVMESLEPRLMLAADLQVAAFDLATDSDYLSWGQEADFDLTVMNSENMAATSPATINFYIDYDGTLDSSTDLELSVTAAGGDFSDTDSGTAGLQLDVSSITTANAKLDGSVTLTLPDTGTAPNGAANGDYHIYAQITDDGDDAINETDSIVVMMGDPETLTGASDIAIDESELPWMPELKIGNVYPGITDVVSYGDALATDGSADFTVSYYLSADDEFDGSDTLLTTDGTNPATVSVTVDAQFNTDQASIADSDVMIPAGVTPGTYYMIAVLDENDVVSEVYDANNTFEFKFEAVATSSLNGVDLGIDEAEIEDATNEDAVPQFAWAYDGTSLGDLEIGYFNTGDQASSVFDIEIYASKDYTFTDSGAEFQLGGATGVASMGSLEYITTTMDISTPTQGSNTNGLHYVLTEIIGATNEDTNGFNNERISAIWIGDWTAGIDLAAYGMYIEGDVGGLAWGDEVRFCVDAVNGGDTDTATAPTITVYISDDADFTTTDDNVEITSAATSFSGNVSAGMFSDEEEFVISALTEPNVTGKFIDGQYTLFVQIEAAGSDTDADATNNVTGMNIFIGSSTTATEIAVEGPFPHDIPEPTWGDVMEFEFEVENKGTDAVASAAAVQFFLSTDNILDGGDTALAAAPLTGENDFASVKPDAGQREYYVYDVTMPSSGTDGDFYVFMNIANAGDNESDNKGLFLMPIGEHPASGAVDLVAMSPQLPDMPEFNWTQSYPVSVVIENDSDTDLTDSTTVDDFTIKYYLSEDPMLDDQDVEINATGTTSVTSGLVAGAAVICEASLDLTFTPTLDDGDYFVIVSVDAGENITEAFESNNNMMSMPINIVSSSSETGINLVAENLRVNGATIDSLPVLEWGGSGVDLDVSYFNAGATDATATTVTATVSISATEEFDAANAITVTGGTGLSAVSLDHTVATLNFTTMPTTFADASAPEGWAYMVVKLETSDTETDADDNIIAMPVWMVANGTSTPANPDFVPAEFEVMTGDPMDIGGDEDGEKEVDDSIYLGDDIFINGTFANIGGNHAASSFDVKYYLNTSADMSGTPVLLGTQTITSALDHGKVNFRDANLEKIEIDATTISSLTPNTDPSLYYVVMEIDGAGAVTEDDTTNNIRATAVNIYDSKFDIKLFSTEPYAEFEDILTVNFELFNYKEDAVNTGNVTVKFYLSDSSTLDINGSGVEEIGTHTWDLTSTPLAASGPQGGGMLQLNNFNLDLSQITTPPSDGDYYIFAQITSTDHVFNTANGSETSIFMPIGDMEAVTGQDLANLRVLESEYGKIEWGTDADITLLIANQGDTAVTTDFQISAYLSFDNEIDSNDIAIDLNGATAGVAAVIATDAAANSSIAESLVVPIPALAEAQEQWSDYASNMSYNIIFKLDSADEVTEAYESNNIMLTDYIQIQNPGTPVSGADVAGVTFFSTQALDTNTFSWGSEITVTSRFKNIGDVDITADMNIKYYISTSPTFENSAIELTSTSASVVAASTGTPFAQGEIAEQSATVTLPATAISGSQFYLYAVVQSGDTNINNDTLLMQTEYPDGGIWIDSADLEMDDDGMEMPLKFGGSYELAVDVENLSQAASGAFDVKIYITSDDLNNVAFNPDSANTAQLTTDGTTPAVVNVTGGLGGLDESINDVMVQMPAYDATNMPEGQYWIVYVADPDDAVAESNEDNNIVWYPVELKQTIGVSTADIMMLETYIEFEGKNDDDDQSMQTTPSLSWGDTIACAEFDLYNASDVDITADFDVTFVLSKNDIFGDGDDIAFADTNTGVMTVAASGTAFGAMEYAFGEFVDSTALVLPSSGTDGLYYILTKADSGNTIAEGTEGELNNEAKPIAVYVGSWTSGVTDASVVDLEVLTPDAAGYPVPVGDTVLKQGDFADLRFNVTNIGELPISTAFDAKFYLSSTDDINDTNKQAITDNTGDLIFTIPADSGALAAGDMFNASLSFVIPQVSAANVSSDGTYYLIMEIDGAGTLTSDPTGNHVTSVELQLATPDLAISSMDIVPGDPVDINWGQQWRVPIIFENTGDAPAENFNVRLVLSADGNYDAATDIELKTVAISKVNPGETYEDYAEITLPTSAPSGFTTSGTIIAIVDSGNSSNSYAGTVVEADETNNEITQALTIGSATLQTGTADLVYIQGNVMLPTGTNPVWGQWVPVDIGVYNDGDTDATSFKVQLALSEDTVWDGTSPDYAITSYMVDGVIVTDGFTVDGLTSGEYMTVKGMVRLPDYTDGPASVKLIVKADATDGINETGTGLEDNNIGQIDSTVTVSAPDTSLIDLMPDMLMPLGDLSSLSPGESIDVKASIVNRGGALADPGSGNNIDTLFYMVSNPTTFDPANPTATGGYLLYSSPLFVVESTGTNGNELAGGAGYSQDITITLPEDAAPGSYYLAMVVNSGGSVTESAANNVFVLTDPAQMIDMGQPSYDIAVNTAAGFTYIDDMGAELVFDTSVPTFDTEMPFRVNFAIKNNGPSVANNFNVKVGIFTAADPGSLVAGTEKWINNYSLTGDGSYVQLEVQDVRLPGYAYDPSATYYIGAIVDPDGQLGNETSIVNNSIFEAVEFKVPAPDIVMAFFKAEDQQQSLPAAPGQQIRVFGEFENPTIMHLDGNFTVSVELRDTANGDAVVGKWDYEAPGGELSPRTDGTVPKLMIDFDIFLPVELDTAGLYKLVMVADSYNVITEVNEDNNESDAIMLEMQEPEIDLALQPLPPMYMPDYGWGSNVHMNWDISSFGSSAAPATNVKVYLATAAGVVDETSIEMGVYSYNHTTMMPMNADLMLPSNLDGQLADGEYYMVVVVDPDNIINESMGGTPTEDNNMRSVPIQIKSPKPNIVIDNYDFMEPELMRAIPMHINLSARNESDATIATPFAIRAVISSDNQYSADDILLAEHIVDYMAPHSWMDHEVEVPVPTTEVLPDGDYYVIIIADADNTIEEFNYDGQPMDVMDNKVSSFVSIKTVELADGVDLIAGNIDLLGLEMFSWNQSYQAEIAMANFGTVDAGSFNVDIVMSTDQVYDSATDIHVGSQLVSALASGQIGEYEITLNIPEKGDNTDQPYYLIMAVDSDGQVLEHDETNNIINRIVSVGDFKAGVDLQIEPVAMPFEGTWGQDITIDVDVSNLAGSPVDGSNIALYLSDQIITPADFANMQPHMTMPLELAGMGSASFEFTFQLPQMPANATGGMPYNVAIKVDSQNQVEELDEFNNSFFGSIYIKSQELADLTVAPIPMASSTGTFPQGYDWGDEITLNTNVSNWGMVDADDVEVSWYLSILNPWDPDFDADDLYSLKTSTIDIPAGMSTDIENTVILLPNSAPTQFANAQELHLVARVDPTDAIQEYNNDDNYGAFPFFLGSAPADLTGNAMIGDGTFEDKQLFWGQTFSINTKLNNFGASDAEDFQVKYYLAQGNVIQNADGMIDTAGMVEIGSETVAMVPEGAGLYGSEVAPYEFAKELTLPTDSPQNFDPAAWAYSIVVVIDSDNVIDESVESNNSFSRAVYLQTMNADLVGFYVDPFDPTMNMPKYDMKWSSATETSEITLQYELANWGNTAANDVNVKFYLANSYGDINSAFELGTTTIETLGNDPTNNFIKSQSTFTLPEPSDVGFVTPGNETGSYTIIMKLDGDDAISEIDENNNMATSFIRLEKTVGKIEVSDSINMPDDLMLDFGKYISTETDTAKITIKNIGEGPLTITGVNSTQAAFEFAANTFPIIIEAQQSVDVDVNLNLTDLQPGFYNGALTIQNDDPRRSNVEVRAWVEVAQAPIDLTVSSLSAVAIQDSQAHDDPEVDAYWGDITSVDVNLANLSATDTSGGVFVDVFLTNSADGMGQRHMLQGNVALTDLAGNSEMSWSTDVTLPVASPFGFSGDLFLGVETRGDYQAYDINWDNNLAVTPLTIMTKPLGKADLAFNMAGMPEMIAPGQEVLVDTSLINVGKSDATAYTVEYYLSADDNIDNNDIILTSAQMTGLSVNATQWDTQTLTIPVDTPEGLSWLLIKADSQDVIDEESEINNIVALRFNIETPKETDLTIPSIALPASVQMGEQFDVAFQIANTGNTDAENVLVNFYLSQSGSGKLGTLIGSTNIPMLTATQQGEPIDMSFVANLPPSLVRSGTEYVITAKIDPRGAIQETDELNNTAISTSMAVVAPSVDIVAELGATPATANWDQSFEVPLTISNIGEAEAAPFNVRVALSNDTTFDQNDYYLTEWPVGLLPATEGANSVQTTVQAYLPGYMNLPDGNYYVLVQVDSFNNVDETDEANTFVSSPIAVSGVADLNGYIQQMPMVANFGQNITVADSVWNYGKSAAESFEISYYLSQDWQFSDTDVYMGKRVIASLASQANNQGSVTFELQQPEGWDPSGAYNIVMVIDQSNQVPERWESDPYNDRVYNFNSMPIEIAEQGMAELNGTVDNMAFDDLEWGATLQTQYSLNNAGTADAEGFTARFYLSDNAKISVEKDIEIGSIEISSLSAGTSINDFVNLTLPTDNPYAKDGQFFIGMIIDKANVVEESNEENNVALDSSLVTIGNVINVDLQAADVYGPTAGIAPDTAFEVYVGIVNAGSEPAEPVAVDLYLTPDGDIANPAAIKIATEMTSTIAAGAYSPMHIVLANGVSAEILGDYIGGNTMFAVEINADKSVQEQLYTNNTAYDYMAASVAEPLTEDAAVIDPPTYQVTTGDVRWGDSVDFSFNVQPVAGQNTPAAIILKDANTGYSTILANIVVPGDQNPYADTETVTMPAASPFGYDGNFELAIVMDPANIINETDEANNSSSVAIAVGSGKAELTGTNLSTVPFAAAGDQIQAFYTIANYGSYEANSFDVYYYLTSDKANFDEDSSTSLGSVTVSSVASLSNAMNATNLTIPNSVENGDYYLAMVVDKWNDVDETDEANNVTFSDEMIRMNTVTILQDDYEPNNLVSTAVAITLATVDTTLAESGMISATLHDSSDVDYYSFVMPSTSNGFVYLGVAPDENLDVAVFVYNQAGTEVGAVDYSSAMGSHEVFTAFQFSRGSTYKFKVVPRGDSAGEYEFEIAAGLGEIGDAYESNNTVATAAYLGAADTTLTSVSIHSGTDKDYFMFTVPGNSTGRFEASAVMDPTLDGVIELLDNDGNPLASSDQSGAGGSEFIEYTGTPGDYYYLKVSSWANSKGSYAMNLEFQETATPDRYESNETIATAYALTSSDYVGVYDANIHNSSDIDFYSVTIPSGYNALELNVYGDEDFDNAIALYDSFGNIIRSADRQGEDGYETILADGLTAGEKIFFQIQSSNDTFGQYSMNCMFSTNEFGDINEPNNNQADAFGLEFPASSDSITLSQLSLHDQSDRDYFKFTAPADTDGTLTVVTTPTATSTALNTQIRLLNANGTVMATTDVAGSGQTETLTYSSAATPLVAGETYYVDVYGWSTTGQYNLQLTAPQSAGSQPEPMYQGFVGPMPALFNDAALATSAGVIVTEHIGVNNDDALAFGTVPTNLDSTGQVTILNTNNSSIDYTVTIAGAESSVFTVDTASGTITAGQSANIAVTFDPASEAFYDDATLTISFGGNDIVLPLSGTGSVTQSKPDVAITDSSATLLNSLSFNDTEVEETSTKTFRIRNEGSADLTVTSAVIEDDDDGVFSLLGATNAVANDGDNWTIENGTPRQYQVEFAPLEFGQYTATLVLSTNDPDEPTVRIPLVANAGSADLTVDTTAIDFGDVMVDGSGGSSASATVTLTNDGTANLAITSFDFNSDDLVIKNASGNIITSLTIAPDSSETITLVFDPQSEATVSDTLNFICNDNTSPSISLAAVAVTGVTVQQSNSGKFYFTDDDGDVFKVAYNTPGDLVFAANAVDADGNFSGDQLSIDITNSSGKGTLTVTDTNRAGDGLLNMDSIDIIGGGFNSIKGDISIDDLNVQGTLKNLMLEGSLGNVDIDGLLGKLKFHNDINSADITAGSIGNIYADGDLNNADITTDTGGINKLYAKGDVLNLDLDTAGPVQRIKVNGNLDADITVDGFIDKVDVKGNISGDTWRVNDANGQGALGRLRAKGSINIADLLVQGDIERIYAGKSSSLADIQGRYEATGQLTRLKVYGDLDASLFSGEMFKKLYVRKGVFDNTVLNVDGNIVDNMFITTK